MPKLLPAVMDPLVTNTRSQAPIGTFVVEPSDSYSSELTVMASEPDAKPRPITLDLDRNTTPLARSQLSSGTAMESYRL